MKSKKQLSFLLSFVLLLSGLFAFTQHQAHAKDEYYVSSAWQMGQQAVTDYATGDGPRAYNTATATLQDSKGTVNVTASFYSLPERSNKALPNQGANPSFLTDTGGDQSKYGAQADMFYGNPDPASIPALGVYVQPGFGEGGDSGSWNKFNFDGKAEAGTFTLSFDREVTDPIIDVSGIGGLVTAYGWQQTQYGTVVLGLGSFNATSFRLVTDGITMALADGASNLQVVDGGKTLDIIDRNTHTRSVPTNSNNFRLFQDGKYRWVTGDNTYTFQSPAVVGAGTGSIILKGTFKEVEFKLDHEATPFSHFPADQYGTSPYYFTNFQAQFGNAYGDGINGLNLNKTETIQLCANRLSGMQNSDLFRLSVRLPKTYNVTHEFKVADDSIINEFPAAVKAEVDKQLPDMQTGKANGEVVTPGQLKGAKDVEDTANDGTWKFKTFIDQDPATAAVDAKIDNADVNFVGEWIFVPNKHKVTYEYKSATQGMELPEALKNKAPADAPNMVKGDTVVSPVPTGADAEFRDDANQGTWKFKEYDKASVTIDNQDEHVIGTWEFVKDQAPKTYNVTHEFKVADDSSINEFPAAVKAEVDKQLPDTQTGKANGEVVTPGQLKDAKDVEDTANDGTWKFTTFIDQDQATDAVDAKINNADVNFVGEWTFVLNKHKVTYEYKSATPGMELPEALKNKAPADVPNKVKGDTVVSPVPTGADAEFRDDANQGTWKFQKYDQASVTIDNQDEHVIGTWEFVEDQAQQTYNVTHEFKVADDSIINEFPAAVKAEVDKQLPDTQTGKVNGEVVEPGQLKNERVVEDLENDGAWCFMYFVDQDPMTGKVDAKINNADITFVGVWSFIQKPHKVTYEYQSATPGMDLPRALKAMAHYDIDGQTKGNVVISPVPMGTDAEFYDNANQGTWKFKEYDRASVTIENQDEHVIGTWEFVKDGDPMFYNVVHRFRSADLSKELPNEVKALLPPSQTGKADGDTVQPMQPAQTTVITEEGTWTFEGYDRNKKTINNADVEFVGIWLFTAKTPDPQPTVHTSFIEKATGKKLAADEDGAQPQKNIPGFVCIDTVTDDAGNVTHFYKKVTTPDPQPTVHTNYVEEGTNKILAPQETGAQPKMTIDGYVFVKTVKDDAGNITHLYKKVTVPDPKPMVHTNYVEEGTNKTLAPQKSGAQAKMTIDGYVFVKTVKDDAGNITHIYKKAAANSKGKTPKTGDAFVGGSLAIGAFSAMLFAGTRVSGKKKSAADE